MAKRTELTKRTRFEVFKRDKFTCQYCGAKSPEVILNVDHIYPVANGGGNDIINLITSCFDCNSGKRDKLLSDSSALEKQRRQLELLQERREQIELMFKWKKSLSEFDTDVMEMITEYINSKISPWKLVDGAKSSIGEWLKKHELQNILDAIDISATNYLKYDSEKPTTDSAELFFNKIGGILHNKSLPPIKQKLSYIKGIARNRFNYWSDQKGAIILDNYVKALKMHYDDDQLLADLEKEVETMTKTADNWTQWRDKIESWTDDINKWEKTNDETEEDEYLVRQLNKDYTQEQLEMILKRWFNTFHEQIHAAEHLASIVEDFDKLSFRRLLMGEILYFLVKQKEGKIYDAGYDEEEIKFFIEGYIHETELVRIFSPHSDRDKKTGEAIVIRKFYEIIEEILSSIYFPSMVLKQKYKHVLIDMHSDIISEALKTSTLECNNLKY